MKIVYICSPLRGDGSPDAQARNIEKAREYCRLAIEKHGVIPIAPHVYLAQFLDDSVPEQRAVGLQMGKELVTVCDEVWVYAVCGASEGMQGEIELAEKLGIPVIEKDHDGERLIPCSPRRTVVK